MFKHSPTPSCMDLLVLPTQQHPPFHQSPAAFAVPKHYGSKAWLPAGSRTCPPLFGELGELALQKLQHRGFPYFSVAHQQVEEVHLMFPRQPPVLAKQKRSAVRESLLPREVTNALYQHVLYV